MRHGKRAKLTFSKRINAERIDQSDQRRGVSAEPPVRAQQVRGRSLVGTGASKHRF